VICANGDAALEMDVNARVGCDIAKHGMAMPLLSLHNVKRKAMWHKDLLAGVALCLHHDQGKSYQV
jgi:hypothetical protein